MGFSFRRSSSFGPFRFNFSKSGIGTSVGVKGARVTLTPRGTTYITVGRGGFSYRQNLSASNRRPSPRPQVETVEAQPVLDEIKTADVDELLESSKSELVANLNKRAQMFNPASILFALAGICVVVGFVQLGNSVPPALPALPNVSTSPDTMREGNRIDEYALLLARYGQPSAVTITQAGSVPLRTATWADAHLAVSLVPAGCVDSYVYFEKHKNDIAPVRTDRRHRGTVHGAEPIPPSCVTPEDKASTVVGYQDVVSGSTIDSGTADRYLAGLTNRSNTPPSVKALEAPQLMKHEPKTAPQPLTVEYDEETLKGEHRRVAEIDAASKKDMKYGVALLAGALLLLVPGGLMHRSNREKRMSRLVYDLSGSANAQQQALDESLGHLTRSQAVWRLDSQSAVVDWKRNAGAAYNVKREQIGIRRAVPPRVESNLVPMCIDLGKLKMFFLPDQVLYWQRGTFASIEYKDLKFEAASTRFIEEQVQTSDSKQVGSTWRYVRKDGGPDRRFNDNRQLPMMFYGVVFAVSSGGLNLVLHTSNVDAASSFTASFRAFQSNRASAGFGQELSREAPKADDPQQTAAAVPWNIEEAMALLGVRAGATLEEIAVAYRHMAQMYHPDKTVGLGPELQKLAEERMKEINAAHQRVIRYLEDA